MSDSSIQESPLVQVEDESVALIKEISKLGYINLRGDIGKGRTKFAMSVKKILGVAAPVSVNRVVENAQYKVFWLGPDEWMLVTHPQLQSGVIEQLETPLHGFFHSVTDVSSAYTTIELAGAYAVKLLNKGCPLDLHPQVFTAGDCAQSLLAQTQIILSRKCELNVFEIIVRRSYADYLLRWLNLVNTVSGQ